MRGLILGLVSATIAVFALQRSPDGLPVGTVGVTDPAPSSTGMALPTTTVTPPSSTFESTTAPVTDPPETAAAEATPKGIARPFFPPEVCEATSAIETPFSKYTITPFGRASTDPLPIQVIGDPVAGPTGPFAVILRYAQPDRPGSDRETIEINGVTTWLHTHANGNGEATWELADGTQGYLRSRGLDRETLVRIVTALTPRDAAAPIPGFDYLPDADMPPTLALVAEHMNSGLSGHGALLECRVRSTDYIYRVSAIEADVVSEFVTVIDRPPPIEVGRRGTTLIIIDGLRDHAAPAIEQLTNADIETWRSLPTYPND